MTTMTLNSTDFNIIGYNRYTNIDDSGAHSNANITFPNNSQYNELTRIGTIHSISIAIDGTNVYSLDNIDAKIANVNEYLNERGVTMSAQIIFDIVQE